MNYKRRRFLFGIVCLLVFCFGLIVFAKYRHSYWSSDWKNHVVKFAETGNLYVPKIIHQTYKNEKVPLKWHGTQNQCKQTAAKYNMTYRFWTDSEGRQLLETHYQWFVKSFDSYRYPIQRAGSINLFLYLSTALMCFTLDALRYFILHRFGGIYVDLDILCHGHQNFTNLLTVNRNIIPKTFPGFSNDILIAEKNSSFMKELIDSLPFWNYNFLSPYLTVMASTGPLFLSLHYGSSEHRDEISVLPVEMYSSGRQTSFFGHFNLGSSWHAWDAKMLKFFLRHWKLFLSMVILFYILFKIIAKEARAYEEQEKRK